MLDYGPGATRKRKNIISTSFCRWDQLLLWKQGELPRLPSGETLAADLSSRHHPQPHAPDRQLHCPSAVSDLSAGWASTLKAWQQTRKQSISEKNRPEGTGGWPSAQLFMPSSGTISSAWHSNGHPLPSSSCLIWKPMLLSQHPELAISKISPREKTMDRSQFSAKQNTAKWAIMIIREEILGRQEEIKEGTWARTTDQGWNLEPNHWIARSFLSLSLLTHKMKIILYNPCKCQEYDMVIKILNRKPNT